MVKSTPKFVKRIVLKIQTNAYSEKVQDYLSRNRETFLSKWVEMCNLNQGRISYEEMEEILGPNYPKAGWIDSEDKAAQIQCFFKEIDFPYYEADEEYLYFP